ncbi:unnamed protein product [Closterium sp. NIES-64]|nr:unnamed protein product [Closterium sp. NIES-64]
MGGHDPGALGIFNVRVGGEKRRTVTGKLRSVGCPVAILLLKGAQQEKQLGVGAGSPEGVFFLDNECWEKEWVTHNIHLPPSLPPAPILPASHAALTSPPLRTHLSLPCASASLLISSLTFSAEHSLASSPPSLPALPFPSAKHHGHQGTAPAVHAAPRVAGVNLQVRCAVLDHVDTTPGCHVAQCKTRKGRCDAIIADSWFGGGGEEGGTDNADTPCLDLWIGASGWKQEH